MLQDVIINMHSVQGYDNDNADSIDFTTDGHYTMDDNIPCLTYMESEITGMKGTRTSVFVLPDSVVVDRDGSVTSRMVFKEGEKSSFLYNTPYGRATLGIRTNRISHSFNEKGGNVEIDYVVDLDHIAVARNRFTIDVKRSGERTNA